MMTTQEYLALPPQEQWAIVEEQVFGRNMDIDTDQDTRYWCKPLPRDFDQPNGWDGIIEEMRKRGYIIGQTHYPDDQEDPDAEYVAHFTHIRDERGGIHWSSVKAHAVRVAALRAVGFLVD